MNIQAGDKVMHWTYGLGQVLRMEARNLFERQVMYYMIQIDDLSIWVPADNNLETRLRTPTSKSEFTKLFAILSGPGEPLPEDRYERKTRLLARLRDGHAESLCRVIRDLTLYQHTRPLNETDSALLKRSVKMLVGEWSYALAIQPAQAEHELQNLLATGLPEDWDKTCLQKKK